MMRFIRHNGEIQCRRDLRCNAKSLLAIVMVRLCIAMASMTWQADAWDQWDSWESDGATASQAGYS
eukprot:4610312-Amphidinium_carterae.1